VPVRAGFSADIPERCENRRSSRWSSVASRRSESTVIQQSDLQEILAWASDEITTTNEQRFMTDSALSPATKGAALVSKAISQQVDVNH
jgi:hypothetical protein